MVIFLKPKDLRARKPEQLDKMLKEKHERLRHLRFQVASKQVKNHRELRFLRREIARITTILSEGGKVNN